jgi:hypothetical protein
MLAAEGGGAHVWVGRGEGGRGLKTCMPWIGRVLLLLDLRGVPAGGVVVRGGGGSKGGVLRVGECVCLGGWV